MRIEIIGRNYNVPDRLKSVIERKFEKLNKYFDKKETESKLSSYIEKDGAVAKFVCTQEKNRERYTLEATIYFGDRMIRAEETSEISTTTWTSSFRCLKDKCEKSAQRSKKAISRTTTARFQTILPTFPTFPNLNLSARKSLN